MPTGAAFIETGLVETGLADDPGTTRLGDVYLYTIAPVAIFLALVVWIAMTLLTSRHRWSRRVPKGPTGLPHRGPVQGGVILGGPSQRMRRDPIPPRESVGRDETPRESTTARPPDAGDRDAPRRAGRSGRGRRRVTSPGTGRWSRRWRG
ncbi:MAG TPA: hypothetical protein VIL71_04590 [Spirillospora sp.]